MVVALLLWAAGYGWVTWGSAVAAHVYRVTGDPRVSLADGVSLPTAARTATVPVLTDEVWSAPEEAARIARGTGAPVRPLSARALERLDPARFGHGYAAAQLASGMRYYATPLGLVEVNATAQSSDPAGEPSTTVILRGVGSGPLRHDEQAALLTRLLRGWGDGTAFAALGARVDVAPGPAGGLLARWWLPGTDAPCVSCAPVWGRFADDGTPALVMVTPQHLVDSRRETVQSAASAYDALRHHADGSVLAVDSLGSAPAPGPVTTAALVYSYDPSAPGGSDLRWQFTDGQGDVVGDTPAERR